MFHPWELNRRTIDGRGGFGHAITHAGMIGDPADGLTVAEILQRGHDQRSGRRSMSGDPAAGPMIADIVRMDPAGSPVMIGGIRSGDPRGMVSGPMIM